MSRTPGPQEPAMLRAGRWHLYVVAYTFFFGAPLLLAPDWITPLLGFGVVEGPWARLVGMLLLGFSYNAYVVSRVRQVSFVRATIAIRAFFAIVLMALGLAGHPPFLLAMAAVVSVGVIGTIAGYRRDLREFPASATRVIL